MLLKPLIARKFAIFPEELESAGIPPGLWAATADSFGAADRKRLLALVGKMPSLLLNGGAWYVGAPSLSDSTKAGAVLLKAGMRYSHSVKMDFCNDLPAQVFSRSDEAWETARRKLALLSGFGFWNEFRKKAVVECAMDVMVSRAQRGLPTVVCGVPWTEAQTIFSPHILALFSEHCDLS